MLGLSLAAQPEHETISVRRIKKRLLSSYLIPELGANVYTTKPWEFASRANKRNEPRICADECNQSLTKGEPLRLNYERDSNRTRRVVI